MKQQISTFFNKLTHCIFFLSNRVILVSIILSLQHSSFATHHSKVDSLEKVLRASNEDSKKIKILEQLSNRYRYIDKNKAIEYSKQALKLAEKINDTLNSGYILNNIAELYWLTGDYEKAIKNYFSAAKNYSGLGSIDKEISCYNNIGYLYSVIGEYGKGIDILFKSLKISDKHNIYNTKQRAYMALGFVYKGLEDYNRAFESFLECLSIAEKLNDKIIICTAYNEMGNIYLVKENYKKSLEYHLKSLKIREELGDKQSLSFSYNDISIDYKKMGDLDKSLEYLLKTMDIAMELDNKFMLQAANVNIGEIYIEKKQYSKALNYFHKGLEYAEETSAKPDIKLSYYHLSRIYKLLNDYKNAYEYYILFTVFKDSIFNEEKSKQIAEIQILFETEKKEKEIELLTKDKALKESEIKKQKLFRNSFIIGFILLFVLAFVFYNRYKIKKKANEELTARNLEIMQQKEEILIQKGEIIVQSERLEQANKELGKQKEEIESQRDKIEVQRNIAVEQKDQITIQKKEMTDSIIYAKHIQEAIMYSAEQLNNYVEDSFVLYKPKDIVSGDFYWFSKKENKLLVAAADCTGHGVPGAFMSIIGVTFLNEIVSKHTPARAHSNAPPLIEGNNKTLQANEILNQLREEVIRSLHQTGKPGEAQDGMDIALCILNMETYELQYAGAKNPLYIIRNKKNLTGFQNLLGLEEIKADRMPISIYSGKIEPFTNNKIQLQKGDSIYIFSDGYADQFGGKDEKKFRYKQFKELLVNIQDKSMEEQKAILAQTFEDWKGNLEQVDDVVVIGIRI